MFRHGHRRGARRCAAIVALGALILASPAATRVGGAPADGRPQTSTAVRDWNLHAINALVNAPSASIPGAGQSTPVSELHLAMVQGAVYDAVNAIDRGHQPYVAGLPKASRSASLEAAVATAAHHVLVGLGVGLVPPLPQVVLDRLDALYADALAAVPDEDVRNNGIAAGAAAAAAMLATRSTDGRYVPFSFTTGDEAGARPRTSSARGDGVQRRQDRAQ